MESWESKVMATAKATASTAWLPSLWPPLSH